MYNKIIRYLTLGFGLLFAVVPIYLNYEDMSSMGEQILFLLLCISPFFAYFFFSRKETRILNLLLPSIPLCVLYALFLYSFIESTSSTSALVFVIAPFFGFGIIIISYLILYFISKFKTKNS